MAGFSRSGRGARIAGYLCVVAIVAAASIAPALAAARKKPVAAAPPSMTAMAPGLPVYEPRPPAARFFTINQVLARLDGRPAGDSTRLAALDPAPSRAPSIADAPSRPPGPTSGSDEPFGLHAFRAPEGQLWLKWRGLQAEIAADMAVLARCAAAACESAAPARFQAVVTAARALSGRARLDAVNRAVNAAVRYTGDLVQHGVLDRWSAPLATLASGRGDCEDYAIVKYVALKAAGMDEQDLRILLVRDRAVRQDHAVLAARLEGRWLVLDNRHTALVGDRELSHFTPLFALDRNGVNLFAAPYAKRLHPDGTIDAKPAAPDANALLM